MADQDERPVLCHACEEADDIAQAETAMFRCRECRNRILCEAHSKKHTKARGHAMMDLNEGVCTIHRDSPLVAFCSDDNTPVCEQCLTPALHRSHTIIGLEEAAVAQRALLEEAVSALAERVSVLEQARVEAGRLAAMARERRDHAVSEIKAQIEALIANLTQTMEALMREAETAFEPILALPQGADARCARTQDALKRAQAVLAASDSAAPTLALANTTVGLALRVDAAAAAAAAVAQVVDVPAFRVDVPEDAVARVCGLVRLVRDVELCPALCQLQVDRDGVVRAALVDAQGQAVLRVLDRDFAVDLIGASEEAKCGWELQGHVLTVTILGLRREDAPVLQVSWRGQPLQGSPLQLRVLCQSWAVDFQGTPFKVYGSKGSGRGQLCSPRGICVGDRELFISDSSNHRVSVLSLDGEFRRQFGSKGNGDGQLLHPRGVAVSDGELFICDSYNHRIMVFGVDGSYLRKWGSEGESDGQFRQPSSVDVVGNEVVVVDYFAARVWVFDRLGTFLRKWGSHGSLRGQLTAGDYKAVSVHGGKVYVSDFYNKCVVVFSLQGDVIAQWACSSGPMGVHAVEGCVWVTLCDSHRVIQYDDRGKTLKTLGSTAGNALGQMNYPWAVCTTEDTLFVADNKNHRVQMFH